MYWSSSTFVANRPKRNAIRSPSCGKACSSMRTTSRRNASPSKTTASFFRWRAASKCASWHSCCGSRLSFVLNNQSYWSFNSRNAARVSKWTTSFIWRQVTRNGIRNGQTIQSREWRPMDGGKETSGARMGGLNGSSGRQRNRRVTMNGQKRKWKRCWRRRPLERRRRPKLSCNILPVPYNYLILLFDLISVNFQISYNNFLLHRCEAPREWLPHQLSMWRARRCCRVASSSSTTRTYSPAPTSRSRLARRPTRSHVMRPLPSAWPESIACWWRRTASPIVRCNWVIRRPI